MARPVLFLSGDPEADALLAEDPLALLVGLVLDQQIPLEKAFSSPAELKRRLGGKLDPARIAEMDETAFAESFKEKPALHRFPGSMAKRVQEMARVIVTDYGGKPEEIWLGASSGKELLRRIEKLPGFGSQKAKIFVALLGKQLGVRPAGWREVSAPFGKAGSHLSIADIDSPEALVAVREHKRQVKAATKATTSAQK